jgi:Tol biopolymer transport system component
MRRGWRAGGTKEGKKVRRWVVAIGVAALCLVGPRSASATYPGANGRIAYFTEAGEFHTILPSGSGDRLLPNWVSAPAWSPSGRRIVGVRPAGPSNQLDLYSMTENGTDLQRLTRRRGDDDNPTYSPSGRRILFTGERPAAPWVMTIGADGSDLRALTPGVAYGWSPNGKWITFQPEPKRSIWAMHPSGTDKHRLVALGTNGGVFGDYSPDGKHILFSRCNDSGCRQFIARANGSNVGLARCQVVSAYSPDGNWFLGGIPNGQGGFDLARVSLAGCSRQKITGQRALDAAWQSLPAS